MPRVVRTDFNLIVQDHAFAVNPQAWDPLFLDYDYIGAHFVDYGVAAHIGADHL